MSERGGDRPREQFEFLDVPVELAARRLLGCELHRELDGELLRVRIVETEAYDQDDPASHSHRGPTPRNQAMFDTAGHLYVYLSHGIHYCCNVVTGRAGYGSGVLIRAVEPLEGEASMEARRGRGGYELTNGPGKVGQALSIDLSLTRHDLGLPPVQLIERPAVRPEAIATSVRVGISKAADLPRRFYLRGNPYVSRLHRAPRDST